MSTTTLDGHFEVAPEVCGGKPRIPGRRITVEQIVWWCDRLGRSVAEVAADHDLSPADIHAALAYYFDHRAEVECSMEQSRQWIEDLKSRTPSKLTGDE